MPMPELNDAIVELAEAALDTARVGLCVADSDGRLLWVNTAFAAPLKLDPSDLVGQEFHALIEASISTEKLHQLFAHSDHEALVSLPTVAASGLLSYLLLRARSHRHASGARFRVVTLIDVGDLGGGREHLSSVYRKLEAVNRALVVVDANAPHLPITYVNHRFQMMTGYSARDAIGRNCRFLQGRDTDQPQIAEMRDALRRRLPCHVVLRNYRKDGSPFNNEIALSPLFDAAGELRFYVAVLHEVTEPATAAQRRKSDADPGIPG
jgi:PAS domain S-box-containing protein